MKCCNLLLSMYITVRAINCEAKSDPLCFVKTWGLPCKTCYCAVVSNWCPVGSTVTFCFLVKLVLWQGVCAVNMPCAPWVLRLTQESLIVAFLWLHLKNAVGSPLEGWIVQLNGDDLLGWLTVLCPTQPHTFSLSGFLPASAWILRATTGPMWVTGKIPFSWIEQNSTSFHLFQLVPVLFSEVTKYCLPYSRLIVHLIWAK